MTKPGKFLVLLCAIPMLYLSCAKDDHCHHAIGLNGEWAWTSSFGGFGGWTLTPQTEGMTKRLIIDDFTYREFVNDSLVLETMYTKGISEEPLLGTEEKTWIQLASGTTLAFHVLDNELTLYEQCFDCFEHRYRRK